MTCAVVDGLWERILDPKHPMHAWLAVKNGVHIGLAHAILHPHTFSLRTLCYLEDLWVTPIARGNGVATTLIKHLSQVGKEEGWRRLYWETGTNNKSAQKLYDRISVRRPTIVYEMDLDSQQSPSIEWQSS